MHMPFDRAFHPAGNGPIRGCHNLLPDESSETKIAFKVDLLFPLEPRYNIAPGHQLS
jgi:hypothetical protein